MGYHSKEIKKGTLGHFSKVHEEFEELEDAFDRGNKVLQLCELCDLIGAIEAMAETQFKCSLRDLIYMKDCTAQAFREGERQ